MQVKIASLEKDIAAAGQTSDTLIPVPGQPTKHAGSISQQSELPSPGSHRQIAQGVTPSRGPTEGQALQPTVNKQPALQRQSQALPDHQPAPPQLPPAIPATSGEDYSRTGQAGASGLYAVKEVSAGQIHDRPGNNVPGSSRAKSSLQDSLPSSSGPSRELPSRPADSRNPMPQQQGLSESADRVTGGARSYSAVNMHEAPDSKPAKGGQVSPPRLHRQQEQAGQETPKKQAEVLSAAMMTPFPDEQAHVLNQVWQEILALPSLP